MWNGVIAAAVMICRESGSHATRCWREMDSNYRSPRMMGGRFSTKGISGNRDDSHLARASDNNFDLDGPGPHRAKSAGQRLRFAGAARNNQGHGEETRRARHDDLVRDALVHTETGQKASFLETSCGRPLGRFGPRFATRLV